MTLSLSELLEQIGQQAASSSRILAQATTAEKNAALLAIACRIEQSAQTILAANEADLGAGSKSGLSSAMLDRARLDAKRIQKIADSVREVVQLTDPVGEVLKQWSRPNRLKISKRRVPIGVIGIIYESRPNVTSDAAALCLKTGNAVILRGGSEAIRSNMALAEAISMGCSDAGLPEHSVQLVPSTERAAVTLMVQLDRYIHLIIPRGGRSLIETVTSAARIPVIKHFDGICAAYVDRAANLRMAEQIVLNAKCQRPSVCNAIETMLVHEAVAQKFLPDCADKLWERGVELRGDPLTRQILGPRVVPATEEDWKTEYLDLILAIKTVGGLEEAVKHIETYGSHHSDAIITDDCAVAQKFLNQVDSAAVFWNASTRFNDGGEFGFGAEIGISTDRLHARGPMGLEELTSYKFVVEGTGQVRD
ncbi:MAG: glutamate-5-semialdehyde dehydrogenase [Verrucomicrobia bacterium]|nr:glutamate-5-semialdehyde dehydrogenase [Verrucomicrobiota bacterium]MBV9644395.1 glutamate-5-semialdehyde dehydrogenase [Verrucomicrobiota bacterium]